MVLESSKSSSQTISLNDNIIRAMISYLKDFFDLVINREELLKIKRMEHLIALMINGSEDIIFQWQTKYPVYIMGKNLGDAYARDDSGDISDDDPIFTGYWQEL